MSINEAEHVCVFSGEIFARDLLEFKRVCKLRGKIGHFLKVSKFLESGDMFAQ